MTMEQLWTLKQLSETWGVNYPTSFIAGSAQLAEGFEPTLTRIASILRATKGEILCG